MTKLLSGRVKKVKSANVRASRYDFIGLSETEPDLGLPVANSYVLASNSDGTRYWISTNSIVSGVNLNNFTTSNLIEGSNLYYTNARVVSAVTQTTLSNLTVSGYVSAGGAVVYGDILAYNISSNLSNSYFVTTTQATVTGNITAGNIILSNSSVSSIVGVNRIRTNYLETNNLIIQGTDVTQTLLTGNVVAQSSTSNVLVANLIIANVWQNLYTANVIESASNLYYTNARVYANVIQILNNFTTSNIVEGSNLYYTNSRVYSNVIQILNNFTTSNIIEGSNLYYTNARVLSVVANLSNLSVSGNIVAGNLLSTSSITGLTVGANLVQTNYIAANIWQGLYTSNIIESGNTNSGNVFFSNARARNAISAGDSTIIYDPIAGTIKATANITASLTATIDGLSTANVAEKASSGNLYYTNSRVYSNVIELLSSLGLAAGSNFTTDQVLEAAGTSNLYYTNARVRTALSGGTGVSYSNTTGIISIGQNVSTTANVQFNNLRVDGNATFYGTATFYGNVTTHTSNNLSVSDNMIYLNSGSESTNPDLGFAGNYNDGTYHHAGFFRDHSDGSWKVFDNYSPEPDANIFINTAHSSFRLANLTANVITAAGYFVGNGALLTNIVLPAGTLNSVNGNLNITGNIIANAAIISGNISAGNISASSFTVGSGSGGSLSGANLLQATYINANIWQNLYTANVIESASNLYYTNARVISAVANTTLSNLTLSGNINAGNVIATSFIGDGSKLTGISLGNTVTGNLNVTGNLTVNATVIANAFVTTGNINASNINVGLISSNVWNGIYTSNVIESASNLYYTNARVYANIIQLLPTLAGQNITIEANGQIRANINTALIAGNLNVSGNIISNATVIANAFITTGNITATNIIVGNISTIATIISNTSITTGNITASNITVGRINANIISVSGNVIGNLTVLSNIIANGLIINGAEVVTGGSTELTLRASNVNANVITANVWNGIYTANVIESGSNLYFTNTRVVSALSAGSGINLYANGLIEGGVLSLSDSQYFTSSSFVYNVGKTNVTMSASVSDSRRVIVSVDGLVQIPTVDYYVNGTVLAFTSNISLNSTIEVKYFGNEAITALSFNPFLFASL